MDTLCVCLSLQYEKDDTQSTITSLDDSNQRTCICRCAVGCSRCAGVAYVVCVHASAAVSSIRATDSLRDAMGKFLDAYFSAQEIMKIQREFEQVRHAHFREKVCYGLIENSQA